MKVVDFIYTYFQPTEYYTLSAKKIQEIYLQLGFPYKDIQVIKNALDEAGIPSHLGRYKVKKDIFMMKPLVYSLNIPDTIKKELLENKYKIVFT